MHLKKLAMVLGMLLCGAAYADSTSNVASTNSMPFYVGPLDPALLIAPTKTPRAQNKTYLLPATPSTTQWGIFDNSQQPVLYIKSGDTVVIQTLPASDNQVIPGVSVAKIIEMNNAVPNRGPHTLTGPIYVKGAKPGDVLRIHFDRIEPIPFASNDSVPGKGLFPKLFPKGQVKYFHLDNRAHQAQFAPGITVPLAPFPGIVAVGRNEAGAFDSIPPGVYGGNLDLREMTEGTTLYLPVFVKGGLVWTGDSHAVQGNGEIDLTALETAFSEFTVTIDLIKNKNLAWPEVETPTSWIAMGYDEDLNKALDITKQQTVQFIMQQRHLSEAEASNVMYKIWNCPISEVVDEMKGAYCIIPKNFNTLAPVLPAADNAQNFVTVAKDPDALAAMSKASMALLKKVSTAKDMPVTQVYILASLTMDCRFAPYVSGDKEVHCMMPKSLWVN